jgi:hypothetical protein
MEARPSRSSPFHGGAATRLDRFVPHTHAEWLASHVPTAHPLLSEDRGHLSLAWASIGEILDHLLERI